MEKKNLNRDQQRRIDLVIEEFGREVDNLPKVAPLPPNTLNAKWDSEQAKPYIALRKMYEKKIEEIENE